jgi:hypothetical protein
MQRELDLHLAQLTKEYIAAGMDVAVNASVFLSCDGSTWSARAGRRS